MKCWYAAIEDPSSQIEKWVKESYVARKQLLEKCSFFECWPLIEQLSQVTAKLADLYNPSTMAATQAQKKEVSVEFFGLLNAVVDLDDTVSLGVEPRCRNTIFV